MVTNKTFRVKLNFKLSSKVKAMIDGINQSNLKNLESFEEQIKQRNITIEALRSDIEEKRKRMEKAENELNVTVEQKERYRVEAQQDNGEKISIRIFCSKLDRRQIFEGKIGQATK